MRLVPLGRRVCKLHHVGTNYILSAPVFNAVEGAAKKSSSGSLVGRTATAPVALPWTTVKCRCPPNTAAMHRVTGRSLMIVYVERLLVAGTRGSFVAAPRVGCAIEDLQLKCN